MADTLYQIRNDKSTRTGGSCNVLAWIASAAPTYLQMITRLAELRDTPRTEQSNFVLGQIAELTSAISAKEDEIWAALEGAA